MNSVDLKKQLEQQYNLICFEDLASVTGSYEFIYSLLYRCRKDVFDSKDRLIFYSGQTPDLDLLIHLQTALQEVNISNWFVLIVCPEDVNSVLDYVKTNYSSDDQVIGQISMSINDGLSLNPASQYTRSDTVCSLPWSSIEIRANGQLTPCCVFDTSTFDKKYNINEHSLNDYYNSYELNNLRQQFINKEKPKGCQSCWIAESSGTPSMRSLNNTVHQQQFKTTSLDNTSLDRVINLDIDLGNLCNLRCRICSWRRSSSIAAEMVSKRKFHDIKLINDWNKESKWITDSQMWEKFEPVIDNLVNLEFEGGEPFFYNWQLPLITRLCDTGKSKNIRLRYSTNATIFPTEQIQYWTKFKKIQLELSIDDIGPRIEYQRDGTDWNVVQTNLKKYQNLKSKLDNLNISFFVTVSLQNLLYLPELLKYCKPFGWHVSLVLLDHPRWLSVFNLNKAAKELVLSKFKEFANEDPELYSMLSGIEQTVKKILPVDPTQTIQELKEVDQIRGQSFLDTHPEMARVLGY